MDIIDTPSKAYLLGHIASCRGQVFPDEIEVTWYKSQLKVFDPIAHLLDDIKQIDNAVVGVIKSPNAIKTVRKSLQIGEIKNASVRFPQLEDNAMRWAFARGYFEGNGDVYMNNGRPVIDISSQSSAMLDDLRLHFDPIPPSKVRFNYIRFVDSNAIDAIGKIYEGNPSLHMTHMYENYSTVLTYNPNMFKTPRGGHIIPDCMVFKAMPGAIMPAKAKPSDVGYDLTVIKEAKRWGTNVTLYDTGIRVQVQHGLYAEVVPRSSLSKSGYMLANSIGIIDPSYTGNIYVALAKVDPSAPELELPFRCCQLIFRRQEHVQMVETDRDFEETARKDGGFGSSGK